MNDISRLLQSWYPHLNVQVKYRYVTCDVSGVKTPVFCSPKRRNLELQLGGVPEETEAAL